MAITAVTQHLVRRYTRALSKEFLKLRGSITGASGECVQIRPRFPMGGDVIYRVSDNVQGCVRHILNLNAVCERANPFLASISLSGIF